MVFRRLLQFSLGVAPHDDQSNPFATSSPLVRSFETTELADSHDSFRIGVPNQESIPKHPPFSLVFRQPKLHYN
jgi:hypothetical protein